MENTFEIEWALQVKGVGVKQPYPGTWNITKHIRDRMGSPGVGV